MFRKNQKFSALFVIISVSGLLLFEESFAASEIKLIVNPIQMEVSAGSDLISLAAKVSGKNLAFEWTLYGPGKLMGDPTNPAVFYSPPDRIEGESAEAIITVAVTDSQGERMTSSRTFTIIPPASPPRAAMSKTTKVLIIGVGAVAVLGGGIILATAGNGATAEASIHITSPVEGDQVDWITNIYGIAQGFEDGDYVTVLLQPYGYEWYPQSSKGMIAPDGSWVVPNCYFGLEGSGDIGKHFRFRVELRDGSGQVKAFDAVEQVTRR